MARKTFIPWLFSEAKKPLYVNKANGHVLEGDSSGLKPDGSPAHLNHAPNGWKDVLVKFARNTKYLGLNRDMSVPMKFVADGAKILRNRMLLFGYECICYFALDKLDKSSFPPQYYPWYVSELDLTTYQQGKTDVSIQAMEGGLSKILKANEGITYPIPVSTDSEAINILLDGIPFTNKISYTIYENQDIYGDFYYMGAGITGTEGSTQGLISQDSQYSGNVHPGTNWFHRSVDKTLNVRIKGYYGINVNVTGRVSQYIKKSSPFQDIPTATTDYELYNTVHTAGDSFQVAIDVTIPLAPSEFLHLRAFPNTVPSASNWYTITGGEFEITYEVTFNESNCKALRPYRVFEQLVDKMTDGKYGVQSSFLQTQEIIDVPLTCGPAIRDYFATDTVIKTTLLEFFQSFRKWGIGLGILKDAVNGDKVIIEKLDYFFNKSTTTLTLGEVSEFVVEPAKELFFNTIETGNKNQEYDKVNGRDEFNVTQLWKAPVERDTKKLDLVSVYRDDMYGIELLRIDLYKKDTTDNKGDNETFRINVESTEQTGNLSYYSGDFTTNSLGYIDIPVSLVSIINGDQLVISGAASNNGTYTVTNTSYITPGHTIISVAEPLTTASLTGDIGLPNFKYYNLNRPAYSAISGLLHPDDSFNIELSPKKALLNNGPYIRSVLDFMDHKNLTFQTGDKNSELSRTLAGVTITEKEDVQIGSLGDRLFRPFLFKFKTMVPLEYLEFMNSNPYGLIYFTYKGFQYNGFMWDGGIKPGDNDAQTWTLLCGPDVDLTKLIDNG